MNVQENELLLEKMSTKICKLTRVVYLLNNKYLETEGLILSLKDSYEEELENLTREANIYADKMKKKCEKNSMNQNQIKEKLEEIKNKYDENLQNLTKNFENYKSETVKYITELKNNHQSKISELLSQLNGIIKQSNEKIKNS